VVQAVLRLTRADDPKAFARAVEGRVTALARAQTLLSKDRWAGADLRAILAEELAAYRPTGGSTAPGGGQVTLDGPPVLLAPGAAQPLAMALHELATNAAKYGALSTPNGRVGVSWRLDPATGALKLRWTERGGPPVAGPPARRGFGSRVVEETLRRQLGGDERRTWAPEGLVCDLEVPADKLAPAKGASVNPAAPDPPSAPPARRRHAVAPTTAAG
jgi:two-component sensor histidine kinase